MLKFMIYGLLKRFEFTRGRTRILGILLAIVTSVAAACFNIFLTGCDECEECCANQSPTQIDSKFNLPKVPGDINVLALGPNGERFIAGNVGSVINNDGKPAQFDLDPTDKALYAPGYSLCVSRYDTAFVWANYLMQPGNGEFNVKINKMLATNNLVLISGSALMIDARAFVSGAVSVETYSTQNQSRDGVLFAISLPMAPTKHLPATSMDRGFSRATATNRSRIWLCRPMARRSIWPRRLPVARSNSWTNKFTIHPAVPA